MSIEHNPPDGGKSIAEALRSAAAFYDRHRDTPEVVHLRPRLAGIKRGQPHPVSLDIPRPAYLRQEFSRWLEDLCETFPGPWDESKKSIPFIVALACDGKAWTKDWRAPGWLIDWPGEAASEALLAAGERLDEGGTEKLLMAVESHVAKRLKELPRNNARAETKTPARSRRRQVQPSAIKIRIAAIKRDNPKASSIQEQYKLFDKREVPVPKSWKKAGKNFWIEAWTDPKFRGRVKRYVAGILPALKNQA